MKETAETTAQTETTPQTPPVAPPPAVATTSPEQKPRTGLKILGAIGLVVLCFVGGLGGSLVAARFSSNTTTTTIQRGADGNTVVTASEADIASVAKKVSPSVVSILTESTSQSYYGGSSTQEGAGSGVIVSKDGYILTNKHVVSGANTVSVVTADGTTYSNVKVVGTDPLNDLAFLKVAGVSNLQAAELGDSSTVRIGQQVVAIGNSLGQYQNTVTSGIISGLGRPITAQDGGTTETLNDLLQTDAAINPGNSGGPLVNLAGQVIGLNTAIVENAQGIGFSIPINSTKGIIKGLLEDGKVERAYLGVNYLPITAEVAKKYNLSVKQGAYVNASGTTSPVVSGSPADKAGVKSGDVITKINDTEVGQTVGLSGLVSQYAPGDKITLTILRDGKTLTVDVTLAAYSQNN